MSTAEVSIINMTIDKLEEVLTRELITEVLGLNDTDTIAERVMSGRLQDDPTIGTGITISIHPNNRIDEGYVNEIATPDKGLSFPTYELGGGSKMWRKYTVELSIYDMGETLRRVSRSIAAVVLSRAENAIRQGGIMPLGPDSFGEYAICVQVEQSYIREGGGEGAFIWRGEIRLRTLNEVEGCL